ncbi:hypothetical protein, variant 2 [Saprolegnia diclina VS20]|uniref:Translin-associated factor X-interacting protein 1 N-terminal domain-containing protein n=1 Tax=Saprolegnia diclina (strain VS20) TaxID=1156394 RepID=T0S8D7_SAPDV|nr:hypothetical protein, variant 2 [Saprolegnia diclina VS20]EQC41513.1 hypothetical protein, variant 2 [Saprolegnia diclina VS20]|eukprot:XP_008605226.1 hypothetical protein, variant 2 [Saprolegnia diclina VS20]
MTTESAEAVRQLLRKDMQREHALHADLLQYIGLREEDLSSASQKHIRLMAQAASVLELNTTDVSAYVAAISDLCEKYDALHASVSTWRRHEAKQLKRKQELHNELREMEHMLAMLDAASQERDAIENVATMDGRLKEYTGKHAVYAKEITVGQARQEPRGPWLLPRRIVLAPRRARAPRAAVCATRSCQQ